MSSLPRVPGQKHGDLELQKKPKKVVDRTVIVTDNDDNIGRIYEAENSRK